MGSTIIGLQKGIATALDEIARNTRDHNRTGAKRKYLTEEDYYQGFADNVNPPGKPKDPRRLRLYNRARERFRNDNKHQHKLKNISDMVHFLLVDSPANIPSAMYNNYIGADPERGVMANTAVKIYHLLKKGLQS